MVGTFGMDGAALLAAGVFAVTSVLTFLLRVGTTSQPEQALVGGDVTTTTTHHRWRWWVGIYALTGATAVGFEMVLFRLVDAMLRSNSYTFAWVLALWLSLFGVGTAIGSFTVRRAADPRRWFLGLQFGVAASTAASFIVAVRLLPLTPAWSPVRTWLEGDGLAGGFGGVSTGLTIVAAVILPLLIMGVPVALMGAALPFVQQLVSDDISQLGNRTGTLAAGNLLGNLCGGVITTTVLVHFLGTGGAGRVLVAAQFVTVAVATVATRGLGARIAPSRVLAGSIAGVVFLLAMPTTNDVWQWVHGWPETPVEVAEDRSCASVAQVGADGHVQLQLNGIGQNGWPYDDFHIALGATPALVSNRPDRVVAVGLGIGSTSYGLLADPRVGSVRTAELCGGNLKLIRRLAEGRPEFDALLADQRATFVTRDGRKLLEQQPRSLDVVVT
ncbi:MAG: hypothetical protein ACKOYM_00560, partial [Actinomycetes bacterium]